MPVLKLYDSGSSEVAVATATSGNQTTPSMAWVSATAYVVVWTSSGAQPETKAQLFAAEGTKIGDEFAIGADYGGAINAVVAQLAGGGFVVAWEDSVAGPLGEPPRIRYQTFDSDGDPVGAEGVVLTSAAHAHQPAIAGLSGGGFVITWTDTDNAGPDTSQTAVYGQLFGATGVAVASAFVVNTITDQRQEASSVTGLPDGGFAVVWQDGSPQGLRTGSGMFQADYGTDIAMQVFDSAGTKIGSQIVVDQMTPFVLFSNTLVGRATATSPVATTLTDGRVAVVWGDFDGLMKTRIVSTTGGTSTDVVVSGEGNSLVARPAITALSDGGYAVSWTYEDRGPPDSSGTGVYVAVYDSSGAAQGAEFVANEITDGSQGASAMLGTPGGGFAMTWQDSSSSSDGTDIVGRHFDLDAGAITDIAFSAASISQTAVENVFVGRLSAEGALNAVFTYELLSDSSGAFRIEEDRLVVDDLMRLAVHEAASVSLEVRVTDTNGNSWEETLVVPIARPASGTLYVAGDQFVAVPNPDELNPVQSPDLLTLSGGRVLLTWNLLDQNGDIVGQLFEADGTPVEGPFTLNTIVSTLNLQHDLAALPNGGFVAAWTSSSGDAANSLGIRAQIFDVNGAKVGSEFVANTTIQGTQQLPSVTGLADGRFFITWLDQSGVGPAGTLGEIKGQFFSSAGAKIGSELLINTTTTLVQSSPVVTELISGKILVAWSDSSGTGGDTSATAIRATLLNSDGSVFVPEFLVNTTTAQFQHVSSAAALAGGGFVIVWRDTSENPVTESGQFRPADIRGQLYDADGVAVGGEFLINQDTYHAQAEPLVVAAPDGGFVVTWSTNSQFGGDDESLSVMARFYGADGTPEGNEFLVNQIGQGQQNIPAATFLESGGLVFAWWDLQTHLADGRVVREISARVLEPLAEVVNGTGQADILEGSAGIDVINGGTGADAMAGGAGNDIYIVDDFGDSVTELDGEGIDEVRTAIGSKAAPDYALYVLPDHVENLTGTSAGAQGVRGNALNNVIVMGAGADLIVLDDGGVDGVDAGGGNDFIYYGATLTGADITSGGAGTDTLGLLGNYSGANAITFTGANLIGVERLALYTGGGTNSYTVTMNEANVVAGSEFFVTAASLNSGETLIFNGSTETDGRFTVHGGSGADTIAGGAGGDFLIGNAGADALYGLNGTDFLIGGLGADQLRGGAGIDFFRYASTAESMAGSVDQILDFRHVDRIDLSAIDANGAGAGNTAFDFIGSNAFGNVAGQLRATLSNGVWTVEGDTNGDGAADLIIQVTLLDPTPLAANDFIL